MEKFLTNCVLTKQHKKNLIAMHNTLLILLVSAFQVFATPNYAQTKKVRLVMNDATVREELYAIQDQSEVDFLYNSELVDTDKKGNVAIDEENRGEILARVLDTDE